MIAFVLAMQLSLPAAQADAQALANMFPVLSSSDPVYGARNNAESSSDFFIGSPLNEKRSNESNRVIVEFRHAVGFAKARDVSSLFNHVSHVVGVGAKKEMGWIATFRNVASVANGEAIRYWTISENPSDAMCFSADLGSFIGIAETAVPVVFEASLFPEPALIRGSNFNIQPESFRGRLINSHSVPPVQVVRDQQETRLSSGPANTSTSLPAIQADNQAEHLTWLLAVASADLLSTSWALKRCPSCYESNPGGVDAEARIALKLGTGAAVGLITWKLERKGNHNWARAVRWIYVGATAVLVANNSIHAVRRK